MKLNLVKGGIFPIIYDKNGNRLPIQDGSTGFNCSATIQGEGKLIGTPCLFIRTSACNLKCSWVGLDGKGSPCDTPYSSHHPEKNILEVDEILETVIQNTKPQNITHIVISGGEPTMQTEPLEYLVKNLYHLGYHITLETNATIFSEELSKFVFLVSMSPKLSTSTPFQQNLKDTGIEYNEKVAKKHERLRLNIPVIQSYIDGSKNNMNDFQLKFVVTDISDIQEIELILNQLTNWSPSDICLMPEGVEVDVLNKRTGWIVEEALKRGWRFSPRLHVMMFGKSRFV
jgi:7-carboxy-7-deazaguanine synthase